MYMLIAYLILKVANKRLVALLCYTFLCSAGVMAVFAFTLVENSTPNFFLYLTSLLFSFTSGILLYKKALSIKFERKKKN